MAMLNLKTRSASSRSGKEKRWKLQLDAHSKELELESDSLEKWLLSLFTKTATEDKPRQFYNLTHLKSATVANVINAVIEA